MVSANVDHVAMVGSTLLACFGQRVRDLINGVARCVLFCLSLNDDGCEKVDEKAIEDQYEGIYALLDHTACVIPTHRLLERGVAYIDQKFKLKMTALLIPASRKHWYSTCGIIHNPGFCATILFLWLYVL